jgi:dCMP deaminase
VSAARPSFDAYLLDLAKASAARATCAKRSVGAVVADRRRVVVATGYNGTPRGLAHCSAEAPCDPRAAVCKAPLTYAVCLAVHAEANALLAAGPAAADGTLAVTVSPCRDCAKLIVNAGIRRVIFSEVHRLFADATGTDWPASRILAQAGVVAVGYIYSSNPDLAIVYDADAMRGEIRLMP